VQASLGKTTQKPSRENKVERARALSRLLSLSLQGFDSQETTELGKSRRSQRLGETVSDLFLSRNILKTNVASIQHCSLIMEFHVEMFGPFVELGIARESNSGLIVRHDVGDRGLIQFCFGQEVAEPL
jgi:hypothetical protein